jgi:hypothetical protein
MVLLIPRASPCSHDIEVVVDDDGVIADDGMVEARC